ncbi:MAG: arsenate reductase ArsC [Acidimicrobiia bacterium]
MTRLVFLCTHNAGRSQMAAAWARHFGGDDLEVLSGGSEPAAEINPHAVTAMAEVGIDISKAKPTRFTDEDVRSAERVVTMGCGDQCPVFPGVRYEDWEIPDPAGRDLDFVRSVRDTLEVRVRELLESAL